MCAHALCTQCVFYAISIKYDIHIIKIINTPHTNGI